MFKKCVSYSLPAECIKRTKILLAKFYYQIRVLRKIKFAFCLKIQTMKRYISEYDPLSITFRFLGRVHRKGSYFSRANFV